MKALTAHRAHDYRHLISRWRKVAARAGLIMKPFARASEHRVYWLHSRRLPKNGAIYISAGIHGDEPAGSEALIAWAEQNVRRLSRLPIVLFPCLNPWGLVNNRRTNEAHLDLNRLFHHDENPVVSALKRLIASYRFSLALTLHEDYDGQGLYLYEIERHQPFWAEDLLDVVRPIIPIEGRMMIDGRRSRAGIVRRKLNPKRFPMFPEAIWLHLNHSRRTFTFETPSEFALEQRVRTQVALIDECVRRVKAETGLIPSPAR